MTIDPKTTAPINSYKLLVGGIVPRPIAFVSTLGPTGVRNLAPFSFFTAVSGEPPVICFCPSQNAQGKPKDTLANIRNSGEFVVNIVSEEFAAQMNLTAPEFPPDVDEFEVSGLTPRPSDRVAPPRVAESHFSMECRLLQVIEVSPGPLGGNLVLGEVVLFHVDDSYIENYRVDPEKLRAIGRMAGSTYARTSDRFDIVRPVYRPGLL